MDLRRQDVEAIVARNIGDDHLILGAGHDAWPFSRSILTRRSCCSCVAIPIYSSLRRRIAVVGTRRCSAVGRAVAHEIGCTLTEAGVSVVSGLALGIDAAAHRGRSNARAQRPAASGSLPAGSTWSTRPRNRHLWHDIANDGVLISETPMGERATRWRFPARNRLIAGLSELVVDRGESSPWRSAAHRR